MEQKCWEWRRRFTSYASLVKKYPSSLNITWWSTLILLSECIDGLGADEFAGWFRYDSLEDMENALKITLMPYGGNTLPISL